MRLDRSRSAIPQRLLRSVQAGTFAYTYRGIPCWKNPFDLALYTLLIHRVRPATVVEIGSAAGGSAVWFADQCRAQGLNTAVISVDLNPPTGVHDPAVRFVRGDVHALDDSPLSGLLERCERPLLVIEDGPHTEAGTGAALRYFHRYLDSGEYIVVEDGIVRDLGYRSLRNGPVRATRAFMREHPGEYTVDRGLCDLYGRNVTWNPNGYLRRN